MKLSFYIFLFFIVISSVVEARDCFENRGALDFGSGSTKFLAVQVDICKKSIVKVLFEDRLALALSETLEKSSDQKIPLDFLNAALPSLRSKLEKVRSHQPKRIDAIATAVFRRAKNSFEIVQLLNNELNLEIKVIPQKQEARLGYWSAKASLGEKLLRDSQKNPLVVWDIGGGSMQMYTENRKVPQIFEGHLASVTFKNRLLRDLKFADLNHVSSPNPLGSQSEAAVQIAKNHALLEVSSHFKKQPPNTVWVGVGGVLGISVQRQVAEGQTEFTQDQLAQTLKSRSLLNDSQLQGDYKQTDVSNLALVLGYMKALGIKKLSTVNTSLGEGLIYLNLQGSR